MSERVVLPEDLADCDAKALNARLVDRSATLDWSAVQKVPSGSVRALLAGLEFGADADVLGLDTLSDALFRKVEAALRKPSPLGIDPVALREEFVALVLQDLQGPAAGPREEVEEARLGDRYLVGFLAPRGVQEAPEADEDGDAGPEEDDATVPERPAARPSLLPSAIGLSFLVDASVRHLAVSVSYGRYSRTEREDAEVDDKGLIWRREPVEAEGRLEVREGDLASWSCDPDAERAGIVVRGRARRLSGPGGPWSVTLFLSNEQLIPERSRETAYVFQAGFEVSDPDSRAVFHRLSGSGEQGLETDEALLRMGFRNAADHAVGHGVGADWVLGEDPERALSVRTAIVPRHEVEATRGADPDEMPGIELDMEALAAASPADFDRCLGSLIDAYERWSAGQEQQAATDESLGSWKKTAGLAIARQRKAVARMRAGLEVLKQDPTALEAFRFMNRAMARQRVHGVFARERRRNPDYRFEEADVPKNRSWRPFQLAFVLLNLPAALDLRHPERSGAPSSVSDLLWFPTGGGKTEAYLGVAAFYLAVRRLNGVVEGHDGGAGVGVVMRYTLRLLTIQQFQRAAGLICASEALRREALAEGDERWGREPFRIGLWVGGRVTPNTTAQAERALKEERDTNDGAPRGGGSPHQLTTCPWCGSAIDPGRNLTVESEKKGRGRTLVYCGDWKGDCLFGRKAAPNEGLPVLVADEEIYRWPPSLLIATVDKFAQMPWRGEVQHLFGRVRERCSRHGYRGSDSADARSHPARPGLSAARTEAALPLRPPDLIIQDELHLISGPLGSLVGLYETAFDELCKWTVEGQTVAPKVIASTATIRRAPQQVRGVFQRAVEVFPPAGLDQADSFFARKVRDEPGRLYLGLCAPGRRMMAAEIRMYFAALAAAQTLYERYGKHADPYMTAVGYFSSMRELGTMRRLVDDDVSTRLRRADARGFSRRLLDPGGTEELTSRRASSEIPRILDRLSLVFDPEEDARRRAEREQARKNRQRYPDRPINVVLATNMISVGVDVDRLGLMLVSCQPKNTAEYIQATSRVGRQHPGVVITLYNWSRPRDLSHYERFRPYHETFYQHVESLSVTPFASRAVDRGLFGMLVSLLRLHGRELNANADAQHLDPYDRKVLDLCGRIVERAANVESPEVSQRLQARLESLLQRWAAQSKDADPTRPLGYKEQPKTRPLLVPPGDDAWTEFTCLMSLRDVEPSVPLVLLEASELGKRLPWKPASRPETRA